MAILAVSRRGQVTFSQDVLEHIGVHPGGKIELYKLPGGRLALRAARPVGSIGAFVGLLAGKTDKVATLDEINDAGADGWADQP